MGYTMCHGWNYLLMIIMISSNGNIVRVTGPLCGNSPVTGECASQRPVRRSFDMIFHLRLKSGWVNNWDADDLRRHRARYDATAMICECCSRILPNRRIRRLRLATVMNIRHNQQIATQTWTNYLWLFSDSIFMAQGRLFIWFEGMIYHIQFS